MEGTRNSYRTLDRKPEGKTQFGSHILWWEENIKMDVVEMSFEGVVWIQLTQDRVEFWAFFKKVKKQWVTSQFLPTG
jgi:hypothetical protein